MSVIQLRPPTKRKPGPYKAKRRCANPSCRCFLRTCNPGPLCDPCRLKTLPAEERSAA